jgi:hypothetical protein
MRFIGVDPGARFTGVAVLESDGTFSQHGEYASALDVWRVIEREAKLPHDPDDSLAIILEDLLGSGERNRFITTTIKIVGYIYWRCIEATLSVFLVPNQARLANIGNVPAEITGKDERSAAAHALTARERWPQICRKVLPFGITSKRLIDYGRLRAHVSVFTDIVTVSL